VAHAPEYVDPVPMNNGLIAADSVAIAVLLAMLAYVVYKCAVAGAQRPAVAALGSERRPWRSMGTP